MSGETVAAVESAARPSAVDARLLLAAVVLGGFAAAGLLAPWLAPFDPDANLGRAGSSLVGPNATYWLGTDRESRDVLSRLLFGARASLSTALGATAFAVAIGTAVGAVAGEAGGLADRLLMRATDLFLAFPALVLLLAAAAFLGRSQTILVVLLGATSWMGTARLVRAEVVALRRREFVLAARALGQRRSSLLLRHVLPHVLAPVGVSATLGLGGVLVAEASLSFLGFGAPDPAASWGKMVAEGFGTLSSGWWVAAFPAVSIALCVTAANLAGDALRERWAAGSGAVRGGSAS